MSGEWTVLFWLEGILRASLSTHIAQSRGLSPNMGRGLVQGPSESHRQRWDSGIRTQPAACLSLLELLISSPLSLVLQTALERDPVLTHPT